MQLGIDRLSPSLTTSVYSSGSWTPPPKSPVATSRTSLMAKLAS